MRTDEIMDSHKRVRIDDLNSNGLERARLAVLMDISETLAILTDMYGIVHGREFSTKPRQQPQQNAGPQPVPQQMPPEPIPIRPEEEDIPKQ